MKKLISLYTSAVLSKSVFYNIFAISVFLFLMSSCAKDVPDQEHTVTSDQISISIPKSEIPNNYIDGETVPEILAEVDKAIKPAELEHRTSDKLPFKVLGYDKSRALKVYNDSFEITSYAFLAYTDLTDINKVVNIVVTQKKNGKPGKPYLYEYTYKPVQNRPQPLLTKIVKYKFNGVKIDLPGANFDPCIDVICHQYSLPEGSGGTGTGSSGGGGGGGYESGGTYGSISGGDLIYTGGGGAGTVICTKTSVTFIAVDGGTVVIDEYTCPGGYSITMVRFRSSQYLSGCCDAVSVDVGVVSPQGIILDLLGQPLFKLFAREIIAEFKYLEKKWITEKNAFPTLTTKAGLLVQAYWNVIDDVAHVSLDICGLIPAFGEGCDMANGILYTIEGDYTNASFSYAAMVPFTGWAATGTKYIGYAVKGRTGRMINLVVEKSKTGIVLFGNRDQLRRAIHLTDPTLAAHHIIPWSSSINPLIQNIAKNAKYANDFFHMNHPKNGIAVAPWRQSGGHPIYIKNVETIMNKIFEKYSDIKTQKKRLVELQDYLYGEINKYPNEHLDKLILDFPI